MKVEWLRFHCEVMKTDLHGIMLGKCGQRMFPFVLKPPSKNQTKFILKAENVATERDNKTVLHKVILKPIRTIWLCMQS